MAGIPPAGRLAGAFLRVGRDAFADEIVASFKAAGYDVRESDPFAGQAGVTAIPAGVSLDSRQGGRPQGLFGGLEEASGNVNVKPFAAFLAEQVKWPSEQASPGLR